MYTIYKVKEYTIYKVKMKVAQSCLTLCDPMDYTVHEILQARILDGSDSILQVIFSTQGSNSGLLHCRRTLYQLRHKGSPASVFLVHNAPCFMEKAKLGASNCTYPLWLPAKQLWSGSAMSPGLSVFISRMGTATSTTQKDHEDESRSL